jgi:acetyl-CoA acetyltransferase
MFSTGACAAATELQEIFMDKPEVVITSAVRTPIGAFQGVLSPATAPQLGAAAIAGAIARGGIGPADVTRFEPAMWPSRSRAVSNP